MHSNTFVTPLGLMTIAYQDDVIYKLTFTNSLIKCVNDTLFKKIREEKDIMLHIILFNPLTCNIEETSILNDPNIVIDVLGPWIDC